MPGVIERDLDRFLYERSTAAAPGIRTVNVMITRSRKSALALAGAVAGTITAASLAGAVNLGLLSSDSTPAPSTQVQLFEPIDTAAATTTSTTEAPVEVVVQDVYDLPSDSGQSPAPAVAPTAPATLTQAPAPTAGGDDSYESQSYESESHESESYESESHDGGEHDSGELDGTYADD